MFENPLIALGLVVTVSIIMTLLCNKFVIVKYAAAVIGMSLNIIGGFAASSSTFGYDYGVPNALHPAFVLLLIVGMAVSTTVISFRRRKHSACGADPPEGKEMTCNA